MAGMKKTISNSSSSDYSMSPSPSPAGSVIVVQTSHNDDDDGDDGGNGRRRTNTTTNNNSNNKRINRDGDNDRQGSRRSSSLSSLSEVPEDEDEEEEESTWREITGFCPKCGRDVGEFYNSWHRITDTYYLPALLGSCNSRLTPRGSTKTATEQTALKGCTIQSLACPGCYDVLAFTVVDAPGPAHAVFRDRDLFKLPRILLKCKAANGSLNLVSPNIVPLPANLQYMAVGISLDHNTKRLSVASERDRMEVETARPSHAYRPPHQHSPPALPDPPVHAPSQQPPPPPPQQQPHQHIHPPQHHAPSQSVELNRQPAPAPAIPSPNRESPHLSHPPTQDPGMSLTNRSRELPPPAMNSPVDSHRPNGQYYPRSPQEVQFDAIERLQTQISHNSGALSVHGRDLRRLEELVPQQEHALRQEFRNQILMQNSEFKRVDDAVLRLQHDMREMKGFLETFVREIRAEIQARPSGSVSHGSAVPVHDSALELMANNLASVSQKANEVDTIKVTMEILKHKVQRLEETATTAPAPSTQSFHSPREPPPHSTLVSHPAPTFHTPTNVPHINSPIHPPHRTASFPNPATPEVNHKVEPTPPQSGWVPVNSAVKRAHPNGIENHIEPMSSIESVKRPKLAPIEPRVAFNPQAAPPPHQQPQHPVYDNMEVDDTETRGQPHHQSGESVANSPAVAPSFIPYPTQEPADDHWRSEPQRVEYRATRGRGRGGSGRGGRPRKSIQPDTAMVTPEWETEDWHNVSNSQTAADEYYSPSVARSGRGVVRRGSGGGGAASRATRPTSSSGRPISLGLQGVTTGPGVGMLNDPYAHTKKTRTKPTRNADGILIRKDGRPDMRSQSSAANLRKVHARKEEQKATGSPYATTPLAHMVHHSPGASSPSPTGLVKTEALDSSATVSAQQKHEIIMTKMFPQGLEASRERHDYARQLFETGRTTASHSRGQGRQGTVQASTEQQPDGRADSHSPHNDATADGDVEMEHGEHGDHESRSPSGGSEGSGQGHHTSPHGLDRAADSANNTPKET